MCIASVSSALMFAVPSFMPIRLRGVSWVRLVVDVRPKPSCDQRIVTVPRPIRAKFRTAWKATWGSSEQAWTQMSPPLSSWFSSSAQFGQGHEAKHKNEYCRKQGKSRGAIEDGAPVAELNEEPCSNAAAADGSHALGGIEKAIV